MAYKYPSEINYSQGLTDLFRYLNEITFNWFSIALLIAIYLIFSLGYYYNKRDFFESIALGSFALFISGLIFWTIEMISGMTFAIVVAVTIISFASLWLKR